MKIVFFGTPDYVVPILAKLNKYHKILVVVTQPPKPVGREQHIKYSPVDTWAFQRHIPKTAEFKDVPEADLGVCAAFGKIIPEEIIKKFKYGILNVHPSLLPKYRGASPIQEAIKNGDEITGVSVIKMDKEMDHGPIVSQFKETISNTDTFGELRTRLFDRSAQFLVDLIPIYVSNKVKPKDQNHEAATFTKVINKETSLVDMTKAKPEDVERMIRAMKPWPGAWTYVKIGDKKLRLKLLNAHLEDGKLVLDEVQLEGKNPVKWKQFSDAYRFEFSPAS